MNVLVIGARRRRQGIGEFVARWFHREGARVCAIVGTSSASVLEARTALREQRDSLAGFECKGYTSLEAALGEEKPHAVAICSPYELHLEQAEAVARAGAHCLCEKPFLWSDDASKEGEAARLAGLFAARGLHLSLITQWPHLLPGFYRLFPEESGRPIESFEMRMSPSATGRVMVPDSLPHPLSMLQALLGPGHVESPRAEFAGEALREMRIEFRYRHAAGEVPVSCRFHASDRSPRPASFAINGKVAHRRIALPCYTFSLETEPSGGERSRSLAVADPLQLLVREFLRKVQADPRSDLQADVHADVKGLVEGTRALEALDRAVRAAEDAVERLWQKDELRKVS